MGDQPLTCKKLINVDQRRVRVPVICYPNPNLNSSPNPNHDLRAANKQPRIMSAAPDLQMWGHVGAVFEAKVWLVLWS